MFSTSRNSIYLPPNTTRLLHLMKRMNIIFSLLHDGEILSLIIVGDEEYLILGCDGLWDTIQPPNVIEMVQEHLSSGGPRSQVAKFLVERAIAHGSTDNVTVVVVFLDCHRTASEKEPTMAVDEGTEEEKAGEAVKDTTKETGDEKASESF
jgi:protein phosphatase 1E